MQKCKDIKVEYNQDGTMSFDSWLAVKVLCAEYTTKQFFDAEAGQKRKDLLDSDNEAYNSVLYELIAGMIISEKMYVNEMMMKVTKIPDSVYMKSQQTYMSHKELSKIYSEKIEEVEAKIKK